MGQIPSIRLFGYGSLMSRVNLAKRAPGVVPDRWAFLKDHEALFAKPGYAAGLDWMTLLAWRFGFAAVASWIWLLAIPANRRGLRRLSRSQPTMPRPSGVRRNSCGGRTRPSTIQISSR